MNDLFIKKCLTIFMVACEDPRDPTCYGPIPYDVAISRLATGLRFLREAIATKGVSDPEVVGVLVNMGGLALAALTTMGGALLVDKTRETQFAMTRKNPGLGVRMSLEWQRMDPTAGMFHYMVSLILEGKVLLDMTSKPGEALVKDTALDELLLQLLEAVCAWCWVVAVAIGEEKNEPGQVVMFPVASTEVGPEVAALLNALPADEQAAMQALADQLATGSHAAPATVT
jgi:hypothetical protein